MREATLQPVYRVNVRGMNTDGASFYRWGMYVTNFVATEPSRFDQVDAFVDQQTRGLLQPEVRLTILRDAKDIKQARNLINSKPQNADAHGMDVAYFPAP
jgi:hypothetical protein